PGQNGIPAGSNLFALILALSLLVGVIVWAGVEWLQTHRIESISRQFGTRTIVLMVVAIALNITLGQTVGTALKLPLYLDSIGTILVGVLCGPVAGAATGILSNFVWSFALAATPLAGPYAWPFAIVAGVIGLLAGLFGYAGVFRRRLDTPPAQLIVGLAAALLAIGVLLWWGVIPYYRDLCPEGTAVGGFCFQILVQGPIDPLWLVLGFVVLGLILAALVLLLLRLAVARDLGAVMVLVAGTATGIVTALVAAPIVVLLGGVTGGGTDLLVAAFQQAGSDLQAAVVQQSLLVDPIDKAIEFSIAYVLLGSLSKRVAARFPQGERALGTDES
ncbi:MAG: hypothetical protein ABUL57_02860, partial [Chloroflexota bacterium]